MEYTFSIGTIGLQDFFPVGRAQDTGNSAVMALAPTTLGTSGMFHNSKVCNPDIYGFPLKQREDPLYITGVTIHFWYFIKRTP